MIEKIKKIIYSLFTILAFLALVSFVFMSAWKESSSNIIEEDSIITIYESEDINLDLDDNELIIYNENIDFIDDENSEENEISLEDNKFEEITKDKNLKEHNKEKKSSTLEDDTLEKYAKLFELVDNYIIENDMDIKVYEKTQEEKKLENDIYELYEEELPENIILDQEFIEKHLKNKDNKIDELAKIDIHDKLIKIQIKPEKKPLYFETPMIAIVIDDMGISIDRTKDISSLHYSITSSFLTYAKDLELQIENAKKAGHEIIAHIPMEAYTVKDAAPDVLKTSMGKSEIRKRFSKMLKKFNGIKGINNHMGSKFTESPEHMTEIIKILKKEDMFFFDSVTSSKTVGRKIAEEQGLPYITRQVFLDNENELKYILKQLRTTEKIAKKRGYAVAIGHPKTQTYEALKIWLPEIEKRGYKLVKISNLVELTN